MDNMKPVEQIPPAEQNGAANENGDGDLRLFSPDAIAPELADDPRNRQQSALSRWLLADRNVSQHEGPGIAEEHAQHHDEQRLDHE